MIDMSTVPLGVFWAAFAGSVLVLDAVILLVGRRYWRLCIPITVLMSLTALLKRSPSITNQRGGLVIAIVVVLTMALSFLVRIRSLRAAYRENPRRQLGELMQPRQQMRFTYTLIGLMCVLLAGALLLFRGLAP